MKSNGNVVAEKNLSLEVASGSADTETVKKVLTVVFVVLLLLLVVLLVVMLIKKLTEDKEEHVEGKTYY